MEGLAQRVVYWTGHLNVWLLVLLPLIFDKSTYFSTSGFFASYTLYFNDSIDATNLGWLFLLLNVVGFNWTTNLWIGALTAAINSMIFLVYSTIVVVAAKKQNAEESSAEFSGVFSSFMQTALFIVLFIFDCLHFNDADAHKSLILFIIGLILPFYDVYASVKVSLMILFVVDFIFFLTTKSKSNIQNYEVAFALYVITIFIIFDLCFRITRVVYNK